MPPISQQDNTSPPSTNAMVPYVSTSTHNNFSVLSQEDVQEDLIAHAVLNKQNDGNLSKENESSTTIVSNTTKQPLPMIPEEHGDPQDGTTAPESESTEQSSNGDNTNDVEDYKNDPLQPDQISEKTPTPKKKKGPGRPKKGHSNLTGLPKKIYNTHNYNTIPESTTTTSTPSSANFVIDDIMLAESGMNTKFKSWADECDTEHNTPPKHGASTIS